MSDDTKRGLYQKYDVRRLHDPNGKHVACRYYVLDLDHDGFAGPALRAYADACETTYPSLAADLRRLALAASPETGEGARMGVAVIARELLFWHDHSAASFGRDVSDLWEALRRTLESPRAAAGEGERAPELQLCETCAHAELALEAEPCRSCMHFWTPRAPSPPPGPPSLNKGAPAANVSKDPSAPPQGARPCNCADDPMNPDLPACPTHLPFTLKCRPDCDCEKHGRKPLSPPPSETCAECRGGGTIASVDLAGNPILRICPRCRGTGRACAALSPVLRLACELPAGHAGLHRRNDGRPNCSSWDDDTGRASPATEVSK